MASRGKQEATKGLKHSKNTVTPVFYKDRSGRGGKNGLETRPRQKDSVEKLRHGLGGR